MPMAFPLSYVGSLTLVVSPHRVGLTVAEANALIAGIHTDDMESSDFAMFYALTEIAETLVAPEIYVPDPEPGCPAARVKRYGTATQAQADDFLARWERVYAQATIHEPL